MNNLIRNHLALNDELLKGIISQIQLPDLEITRNVFHDLMSCIIEQQIHYRSTKKIFQKMLDAASLDILTLQNFPEFEEKGFKNIKLSAGKFETLGRVLDFFEQNTIDWQQKEDGEVRQLLSQIKGVGAWTIDMLLLYTLERQDVFPNDDYHLKQMMVKLYTIDTASKVKAQLQAVAENWSPYRSFGVKYLLAWKSFPGKF